MITKYAPDGSQVWLTLLGGSCTDYANCAALSPDETMLYVVGYSTSMNASGDILLGKYATSDGQQQWLKYVGTSGPDSGDGVAVALRCRRAYCAGIDGEWWFLQGLGGDAEKCPGYG